MPALNRNSTMFAAYLCVRLFAFWSESNVSEWSFSLQVKDQRQNCLVEKTSHWEQTRGSSSDKFANFFKHFTHPLNDKCRRKKPESVCNWSARNKLIKYNNILQVIHVQKSVWSSLVITNYAKHRHKLQCVVYCWDYREAPGRAATQALDLNWRLDFTSSKLQLHGVTFITQAFT